MPEFKIIINILIGSIITMLVLFFWSSDIFINKKLSNFRNIKIKGVVINKSINRENYEKTHTLLFSDSTKYVVSNLDLDNIIEVGDSIYKNLKEYSLIIYKKADTNKTIIYYLPCEE